jgi:hypothetical protein
VVTDGCDACLRIAIERHAPGELRATVNPRVNLAHCFCCGQNFNNIDLLIALGYDFLAAVEVLEPWLRQHCERRTARST